MSLADARRSQCRTCRAPIVWVTTSKGRRMPLDAAPAANGTITDTGELSGEGTPIVRVVGLADAAAHEGPLYVSHFATCPDADEHRKPSGTLF